MREITCGGGRPLVDGRQSAPRHRPSVSRLQAFVRETTQRVGAHVVIGSIVLDENKVQHFQVRRRTSKSVGDIIADKSHGLHHRKGQFMGEAGREQFQIEQKVCECGSIIRPMYGMTSL